MKPFKWQYSRYIVCDITYIQDILYVISHSISMTITVLKFLLLNKEIAQYLNKSIYWFAIHYLQCWSSD